MAITNIHSGIAIDEIAGGIYRIIARETGLSPPRFTFALIKPVYYN